MSTTGNTTDVPSAVAAARAVREGWPDLLPDQGLAALADLPADAAAVLLQDLCDPLPLVDHPVDAHVRVLEDLLAVLEALPTLHDTAPLRALQARYRSLVAGGGFDPADVPRLQEVLRALAERSAARTAPRDRGDRRRPPHVATAPRAPELPDWLGSATGSVSADEVVGGFPAPAPPRADAPPSPDAEPPTTGSPPTTPPPGAAPADAAARTREPAPPDRYFVADFEGRDPAAPLRQGDEATLALWVDVSEVSHLAAQALGDLPVESEDLTLGVEVDSGDVEILGPRTGTVRLPARRPSRAASRCAAAPRPRRSRRRSAAPATPTASSTSCATRTPRTAWTRARRTCR